MQNITGNRIRLARHNLNITQEELAARLQLAGLKHTRNTIAKIEIGIRQVTDIEVKVLAQVLGVSISWLYGENVDENH